MTDITRKLADALRPFAALAAHYPAAAKYGNRPRSGPIHIVVSAGIDDAELTVEDLAAAAALLAEFDAAGTAARAHPIEAGFALVPVKPTEEMHVAAVRTIVKCRGNDDFPPRVWAAMLAAAPAAQPAVDVSARYPHLPTRRHLEDEIDRLKAAQPAAAVQQWRPIETVPKDGSLILVTNGHGSWVARWAPVAPSGYRFEQPLHSMMLNCNHIPLDVRYEPPTQWMPLPAAPLEHPAQGVGRG